MPTRIRKFVVTGIIAAFALGSVAGPAFAGHDGKRHTKRHTVQLEKRHTELAAKRHTSL